MDVSVDECIDISMGIGIDKCMDKYTSIWINTYLYIYKYRVNTILIESISFRHRLY